MRSEDVAVKGPAVLKDFYRFQKRNEKREGADTDLVRSFLLSLVCFHFGVY